MIISKNNGKWTSAIFKIFWPLFWCKLTTFLRCPDSFIQSFWGNLENITKIMLKSQFSLKEFKLSCGTTSMTLRFIAAVLKINEFYDTLWYWYEKSMRLIPRRRRGQGGCWGISEMWKTDMIFWKKIEFFLIFFEMFLIFFCEFLFFCRKSLLKQKWAPPARN